MYALYFKEIQMHFQSNQNTVIFPLACIWRLGPASNQNLASISTNYLDPGMCLGPGTYAPDRVLTQSFMAMRHFLCGFIDTHLYQGTFCPGPLLV